MSLFPSRGRVLIIDDDPQVVKMIAAHAKAAGYKAKATGDAEEFYGLARSWNPTFVVVDLVMGEVDGLTVLRKLAEMESQAVVVIASGMGSEILDAARQFAAASGLSYGGVLRKPFRRTDVAAVLRAGSQSTQHVSPLPGALGSLDIITAVDSWDDRRFEEELRAASTGGDLGVAFQPKVSCVDGTVAGFEVLVRWEHPVLGVIPAPVFIPRAETAGLVSIVTDTVAATTLSWFAHARRHTTEHVAINISATELVGSSLCARLKTACSMVDISPGRIVLELTETSAIPDETLSLEVLTRLRLAGFKLSIDDFGTGYSSMSQLSSLPFSEIKIDRSFVQDLGKSTSSDVMVRTMIQLGHGLGLRCTAEGVETSRELAAVTEMGCDYVQGYLIAHPMNVTALEAWLKDRDSAR